MPVSIPAPPTIIRVVLSVRDRRAIIALPIDSIEREADCSGAASIGAESRAAVGVTANRFAVAGAGATAAIPEASTGAVLCAERGSASASRALHPMNDGKLRGMVVILGECSAARVSAAH
jgi:hypothetical protein